MLVLGTVTVLGRCTSLIVTRSAWHWNLMEIPIAIAEGGSDPRMPSENDSVGLRKTLAVKRPLHYTLNFWCSIEVFHVAALNDDCTMVTF